MVAEFSGMAYQWPADTDFSLWELDVLDRYCLACGRMMHICDHRYRRFHTLAGPVQLICKLNHCPDPNCPEASQIREKVGHGDSGGRSRVKQL